MTDHKEIESLYAAAQDAVELVTAPLLLRLVRSGDGLYAVAAADGRFYAGRLDPVEVHETGTIAGLVDLVNR